VGLTVGQLIAGRYRLQTLLGAGGMGTVWSAEHLLAGTTVALKVMTAKSDDARRRFLREARIAMTLRHANVVVVHDVLEMEDGHLAMVMDRLDGEDLASRLRREPRISVGETCEILAGVVAGVAAAHALGIVHRDLKPENVFLVADGVKVLDFGVAKLVGDEGIGAQSRIITGTGALVGTPYYMSPEQVFVERDIDARADVWSLGVILYECLAGVRPTDAENVGQVLKRIMSADFVPLERAAAGLPPELAALAMKMLSPDRRTRPALPDIAAALGRYASASSIATADTVASAPPSRRADTVDATMTSVGFAPAAWRWRRWGAIGALGAALLVAGVTVARRAPRLTPSAEHLDAATPERAIVSSVPAALAEYEAGLDGFRHGGAHRAMTHFERALELDPTCQAAHVRLAVGYLTPGPFIERQTENGRVHFFLAQRAAAQLDARDRALLHAIQPLVEVTVSKEAFRERMRRLADERPTDAEVAYLAASAADLMQDHAAAEGGFERTLVLDPTYGPAYGTLATLADRRGDTASTDKYTAKCLAEAPAAGLCHWVRRGLLVSQGRCDELLVISRAYKAAAPDNNSPRWLAEALFAAGRSGEAIEEVLRSEPVLLGQEISQLLGRVTSDTILGRFSNALVDLRTLATSTPNARQRGEALLLEEQLRSEMLSPSAAEAALTTLVRRSEAWPDVDPLIRAKLEVGVAHARALQQKGSRDELLSARRRALDLADANPGEWLGEEDQARERRVELQFDHRPLTDDDSREVVRAMEGVPAFEMVELLIEAKWRLHDAAGVVALVKSPKNCPMFDRVIPAIRTHLWAGLAYEELGDVASARAEYEKLLSYWSDPKETSSSAATARAHLAKLPR
jgi:tetratricopeptide (TPR) repeat protein